MPKTPTKTKEDAERQEHIRDLQRQAKEFSGDDLSFFESEQMSTELQPCRSGMLFMPDISTLQ